MDKSEPNIEPMRDWEEWVKEILELNGDERPESVARRRELHQKIQGRAAEERRRFSQLFGRSETDKDQDWDHER